MQRAIVIRSVVVTISIVCLFSALIGYQIQVVSGEVDQRRTQITLGRLKQIAESLAMYRADFDGYFPATTSMPSFRAVLMPYVRNGEMFEGEYKHSSRMEFNFNLAGVHESLPLGKAVGMADPLGVAVLYCRSLVTKSVFVVAVNDLPRVRTESELQTLISAKFDLRSVKLQPPNYLENKDPLK